MTEKPNTLASAFPSEQGHIPDGTWNQSYDPGMTVREWFAGQALAGTNITEEPSAFKTAQWVVIIADALIEELAKQPETSPVPHPSHTRVRSLKEPGVWTCGNCGYSGVSTHWGRLTEPCEGDPT